MPSIAIPKVPNFIPLDAVQRSIIRPVQQYTKKRIMPLFK